MLAEAPAVPPAAGGRRLARTDRRGRFSVTLPAPPASERFAVYRLRTTSGGTTYTLPLVLRTPSAAAG